jgi:hypothetical protein
VAPADGDGLGDAGEDGDTLGLGEASAAARTLRGNEPPALPSASAAAVRVQPPAAAIATPVTASAATAAAAISTARVGRRDSIG